MVLIAGCIPLALQSAVTRLLFPLLLFHLKMTIVMAPDMQTRDFELEI